MQVDPLCDFDPALNSALNVVSLDKPEVKCTVTWSDIVEVEEEAAQRLSPLAPAERLQLVMDPELGRDRSLFLPEFGWSFSCFKSCVITVLYTYKIG